MVWLLMLESSRHGAWEKQSGPEAEADVDVDAALTLEERISAGRLLVQTFAVAMVDKKVTVAYKEQIALQKQQELIQEEEQV